MIVSNGEFEYYKAESKPSFLSFIQRLGKRSISNSNAFFEIGKANLQNGSSNGNIAELIVYDRLLSRKQRNKIESYLSIKYGISLPLDAKYYNSQGEAIWTPSQHGEFVHNVTGIGRDDESGLLQKQSTNQYDEVHFAIALDRFEHKNENNTGQLNNSQFIIWA